MWFWQISDFDLYMKTLKKLKKRLPLEDLASLSMEMKESHGFLTITRSVRIYQQIKEKKNGVVL